MAENKSMRVAEASAGERLDRVTETVLPDSGLRLRRRLCEEGRVLVDDCPRGPGYKVAAGQRIELLPEEAGPASPADLGLLVVAKTRNFVAVYKPGGVHSAAIAGKEGPCAEAVLADLVPGEVPVLLNRLDFLTSGLLLAALNPEGESIWRRAEETGIIRKFYLAEVRGRLDGMVTVRSRLDTADRATTRVLDEPDPDPGRWTDVKAVGHDRRADTSRVLCLIARGARHQIRAHLASIDHPIIGDPLYGDGREGEPMHLHHQRVELPGFTAEVSAPF
ncbi:MAG: pseudouridine synthase [Pseudodesulfovibrio sp.]